MYEFVLTDLTGVEVSELAGASEKRFARVLRSIGTAGATVPLAHEDADTILECNGLLKVYEVNDDFLVDGDKTLMHAGRLVGAEETNQGKGTVKFTSADAGWIAARRLIGKLGQVIGGVTTPAGGYSRGDVLAQVNRATILGELLDAVNAEDPSGLRAGGIESVSSTYVAGWRYKPLLEALVELTASLDGPDWRVDPIEPEPSAGAVAYFGELNVASILGQFQEDAAFEYGDGLLNVGSYRRAVTLDGTANQVFSLPGGADAAATDVLTDAREASIADRGLLEAIVSADLTVEDLRERLLSYHLDLRHGPRQTITFDPVRDVDGRVHRLGREYDVGDIVPFRAWLPAREPDIVRPPRIDINVRVYQADVSVDSAGAGTTTLTVTPSTGG